MVFLSNKVNKTFYFGKAKWSFQLKKALLLEHLLVLKKVLLVDLFQKTLTRFAV